MNYVPAKPQDVVEIEDNDRAVLGHAIQTAGAVMAPRPLPPSVRTEDSVVTQAYASLLYSAAYALAAALITGGLILFAWLCYGGAGEKYGLLWLLTWGICVLVALIINRAQGLKHSATGIAHHEIEARERLAMYAIDQHIALIERRWRSDKP